MDKITQGQKLKCLFGHHNFFQSGQIRQCVYCKLIQVLDFSKGNLSNPQWVDIGSDFNFDLEEFDKIQRQIREIGQQRLPSVFTTSGANECYTSYTFISYTSYTTNTSNRCLDFFNAGMI